MIKLKEREKTAIINALKAGVVPGIGLPHIQVGRKDEIAEMIRDIEHIKVDGATVRFVVGDFGAGKSFFLILTKLMAHEKQMVVMSADITIDKIFCSTEGKARSLLTELLKNMSTRSKPEGAGLKSVIESWISKVTSDNKNLTENDFYKALEPVSHLLLSQDFAKVLYCYYTAFKNNDSVLTEKCIKWIRAEYETKTEAKNDLGVGRIIEDSDFYDALKLISAFVKLAGFAGTLILIDELAVLTRQQERVRKRNYETVLAVINDCLQGNVKNTGFIFGATSDSVYGKERGLYSYGALETRLSENKFTDGTTKDFSGIVIELAPLTKEELFVLLVKLQTIFMNDEKESLIPEEGIKSFFAEMHKQLGAEEHATPRDIIKHFLNLLSVIQSNPGKKWTDFIGAPIEQPANSESNLVKLKVN